LPFCNKKCYNEYLERESDRRLAKWHLTNHFDPRKLTIYERRKLLNYGLIVFDNIKKMYEITEKGKQLLNEPKSILGEVDESKEVN